MKFIVPAITAAFTLALGTSGLPETTPPEPPAPSEAPRSVSEQPRPFSELSDLEKLEAASEALSPLLERIADAEGGPQGLNAVNRGYAGDTPGGSIQAIGRKLTNMTLGEVLQAQRSNIYAVGGYQFIPKTLRGVVTKAKIDRSAFFDEELQQQLAVILIRENRPVIWDYVTGKHGNLYAAQLAFAQEWASIGHPRHGYSYYAGIGGNRAKVRPGFVSTVLIEARGKLTQSEIRNAI